MTPRWLRDALVGFLWFTATLTPYMLFVVGVDARQYLAWVGMQALLVPPLSIGFGHILRWLDDRSRRTKEERA